MDDPGRPAKHCSGGPVWRRCANATADFATCPALGMNSVVYGCVSALHPQVSLGVHMEELLELVGNQIELSNAFGGVAAPELLLAGRHPGLPAAETPTVLICSPAITRKKVG